MSGNFSTGRFRVYGLACTAAVLAALLAGGPATTSVPEAEVNVSAAAGYQGLADVAVDPRDSTSLVVAGQDAGASGPVAWSSVDGGTSFTSGIALPLAFDGHTFAEGSEPTVAVGRDGTWYAAYEVHDLDGASDPIDSSVVVARSFDGLLWEAAAIVEDNRGAGASPSVETPHIAVDPSATGCTAYFGRVHLVWVRKTGSDRAVYRSYSSTDGTSWATLRKINDGVSGAEDVWRPRVAAGPDGLVYTAWLDDVQKTIVVDGSDDGGANFAADVNAAGVTLGCGSGDCGNDLGCSGGARHGSTPTLAVDVSWSSTRGAVYVGFADEVVPANGMDVFVTSSSDGGATWSSLVQVNADATRQQYGPALAVQPANGALHAAWYDRRADDVNPDCETEVWHAVSGDAAATWTDETAVSSSPSDFDGDPRGEGAHLGLAAAGVHVYPVWTDRSLSQHEIYLGRIVHTAGTVVPGGSIDTSTSWLAANSPFIVLGDVTVDPGVTLAIEAGAEVRFATCDELGSGIDANRIELIVEGILDVAGTSGNEVLLISGAPAGAQDDWYGIRFQDTFESSDSTLRHARIEHTRYALRMTNSSPLLEDMQIDLAAFNGIRGSARAGLPFSPRRVTVSDAGTPVSLTEVSGTWTDVTLQDSAAAAGTISGGALDLRLVGMRVLNNANGGLTTNLGGGGLEIIASEFTGNGGTGLTVEGNGPRTLVANDYENNSFDGLVLENPASGWPTVAVYASNFVGNGSAVRLEPGSLPADARRNWWGALSAEMGSYPANVSGIWDIHDDPALRHVDFRENLGAALSNDGDVESYLVFPDGMNENEMVIYGGAVAREGILRVEISTDGGTSWSDATVEGAAFSLAWAPTPGTYTVLSRVTDLLGSVEAVPDQKIITIGAGPTLAGTLLEDETWSGPATIELIGDVVVPAGITLTIDPGTTVHAQFLTDAAYGGLDPSRIEIIVEGVLVSNGATGNEVVWDSSRAGAGAEKGDWYGIRYLDTTTDELSIVQATRISHGVNCLELEQAAPDVLDSTISNCSQDGLSGDSGGLAKPLWRLSGNTIQDNDGNGVDVQGSTEVEVLGTTVTGNGNDGLVIDASPNVVTVTDATISNNGGTGLWINSGSSGFRLLDSVIQSNGLDGVFVSTGGNEIRLERLLVANNGEDGIEVLGGTELVLLKSSVVGNMRGLRVGSPRLVGAYNTISYNTGEGVDGYEGTAIHYYAVAGVPAVIGMSDLDNDVNYETYLVTNRALNARRNYWGAITTANMQAAGYPADLGEFWDIHEDGAHGTVDYDNWALASVAGSAPGDLAAHITWPASGATVDVHSVIVTGVAYARDGIDRVEVCVRKAGDPVCGDGVGDTPYGVVTGKEAWTFEWFPPSSDVFELQARVVDVGEVKSVPGETITIDATLLGATVTGPVALSGPIIGNQTWSGAIELTGDVIVEAGMTLTLLAGTEVRARALVDDRLGGEDTSRIELIVHGNLVTQGTVGSPVTFSSTRAVPERRDWSGIRFESLSDAALNDLDSTRVSAAWHGLEFRDTFSALDDVWSTGNYGIGLNLSSVDDTIPASVITGGSFSENGSYGIYVQRAEGDWLLEGVTIADNEDRGLYFWNCQSGGNLVLDGVEILRNAVQGVRLRECARPVELLASTIDGNGGIGFDAHKPTRLVVRSNSLSNQLGAGMVASYPGEIIVSKNTFAGNQASAQVSDSGGQSQVVFNEFGTWTNAGVAGLEFTGGTAAGSRNAHFNNFREYAPSTVDVILSNAVAASVNARVNYWDPDTTSEMDLDPFPSNISSIVDVEDNPTWGRVDWRAHLAAAVDLSAGQLCGFTNPVGGDTLTGTTFNLQGAAAADAGIQHVEIAIDDIGTWYPAVGEELWTYSWTPLSSGNYTLYCRVTDDDGGVQAAPSSVLVTVNAANVTTSGTLTDDETWAGVIVLTGDVTVPDGITLTIAEGALIEAMPQSDDQFGGADTSRIELIIEGTLNLQGSGAVPVTFTSHRSLPDVPTAGDWYGIRLTDTADSSVTIHDAVIEAGVRGIWGYPGSHQDVVDCVVRDMTEYGIYMDFGGGVRDVADEGMLIRGNLVERTGHTGIRLYRSASDASWNDAVHRVDANTTDDTGTRAIYVCPSRMQRTEITDNVVSDASNGIYVTATNDPAYANHMQVTGNQITNMGTEGYYQYSGRTTLIQGNTVSGGLRGIYTQAVPETRVIDNDLSGGAGAGIFISGTGDYGYVYRNSVTGYAGDGIVTDALGGSILLYNTVSASGGDALQLTNHGVTAVPRVHWNNLDGSTDYDVRLGGLVGADMRRNYWAGTNGELQAEGYPSEISEIWDIEDDPLRGRADYRGVENLVIDTNVTLESRFVWPFEGDTISDRTIRLEGTAYAEAGVQLVELSTDGGTTWLPASGTEFWTFTFTPATDGLHTFRCRVTDAGNNVEPSPDAVTVTFDSALPTTEGTLPDDETWSGPAPIVLTGDVVVPQGTTLTIDPGTTIRVQPLADNSWSGLDIARIELIVEGTLDLQGLPASPVTFTSDRTPGPLAGDWYGIRLTDTADSTVTLHDLVVEAGIRGIWSSPGSHQDVVDCVVRDMSGDGIYLEFGNGVRDAADPGMLVSGNTVERIGGSFGMYVRRTGNHASWDDAIHLVEGNTTADTGSYGIYGNPGQAELSTFAGNDIALARYGIYIDGTSSTANPNHVEIRDNLIADTVSDGIYQYSGRSSRIEGNTLTGGLHGIHTDRTVESRIVNNDLTGGTGTGILVSSSAGESDIYVLRNSVTDFGGRGIFSNMLSKLVALYNTIDNVGGDAVAMRVYNAAGVPRIHWNNIQGSTGYDASLSSLTGADLRRNYWSGTNGEMLAEGYPAEISEIWDIEDDSSKGRIDYRGVENLVIDTNVTLESRFVWPFDGDMLGRRSITLEGTAYAEDGIQLVEVSTDGGATWLPASGTDSWTFSFNPSVDGLQSFLCRVTDVGDNVEAAPDAVTVTFDGTAPTTEGTLPANETWAGPGPVVLTGDVIVPAGTTLTVDPGTTILVQPLADNSRGGVDTSRIELIVEGTLMAQGSGPGSIVMTSDSSTPEKGHWYGIRYDGLPRTLPELRALTLEWGVKGLSDSNWVGVPDLDLIEIRQMEQDAIHATSAPVGTGDWTMRDVQISQINSYGARIDTGTVNASVVIDGFDIAEVGGRALSILLDATEELTIRDSTFVTTSNSDTVYVQGPGTATLETVRIEHPFVVSGSAFNMYTGGGVDSLTVEDSEITGGYRSLYLERVVHSIIRRSLISGGANGVYLQGYSASSVISALVENSRISDVSLNGVYVGTHANAILHYNDMFNIAGYSVNNQSPYAIDAADNYWGEDTETEMNAKGCDANIDTIYDWHDSGSKGLVTYCDYATDPFGDQPTIFFGDNAGQREIHWNPKADLTYDLIRGDLVNLAIAGAIVDLGPVVCEQQVDGSGSIVDGSPDPIAGQGWFFLMRDHVTPGNYGLDSSGRERVPASGDCP